MSKFMKMLNNISRSQAIYRNGKISADDLHSSQYAFILAICRDPGRSQDFFAKELCLNKSTVARTLNALEEKGYIKREISNRLRLRKAPELKFIIDDSLEYSANINRILEDIHRG